MKKFLLLSTLAVAMTANAADYGTSPETATDAPGFWFPDQSLVDNKTEVWFKFKVTTQNGRPALYPSMPPSGEYKVFQCADGTMEAPKNSNGVYVVESGKEYLFKFIPDAVAPVMLSGTELRDDSEKGAEYYPIEVGATEMGLTRTVEAGQTVWYKINHAYPSTVTTNFFFAPVADIEKVAVKHQECPGGVNEGNSVIPPYNKAGVNLVGVTASAAATAPVQFQLGTNATAAQSCNNNLSRGPKLGLDEETTYPNAYWTVDRVFEAPEDGEYTFINHAAKGSELNIGKIVRGDADTSPFGNKLSCDFSEGETAIVGDKDAMIVKTLAKGDLVAVQSDVFTKLAEGAPYLKVVKGNATGGINNVGNDNNTVEIVALGGKSFSINNVLLAGGAKVVAYDMNARKVAETAVAAGTESQVITLDVPSGIYLIVVYGNNRSASAKVVVE